MSDLREAVLAGVEAQREYLIATAQELVRTPSVNHPPTGDEKACQLLVASHLRAAGLRPEVYALDDNIPGLKAHPSYWPGRDYSDRPNVVARRAGSGGGPSLVLSGHIDTVPLGLQPWSRDPFAAQIENGRLYGLGAYDMKGGVTLILGVARTLDTLGLSLKGDLIAETVVDEEFGGVNGTLAGRLRGGTADAMIITEPSGLAILNGTLGGRTAHITLSGMEGILFEGGESGQAVRQLGHLLKWVDVFRQRRRAGVRDWQPGALDPVPVWVTKVYAGGWGMTTPITVPAEAKVELYWQLRPGEEQAQVDEEFFIWLDDMIADKPNDFVGRPTVEFPIRFMPAAQIDAESPFIQMLSGCAQEVTGQVPDVKRLMAPSDLYVVQREFGIPAVHYGLRGANAHAADEYLMVDDLVTATQVLTLLAVAWCGVD